MSDEMTPEELFRLSIRMVPQWFPNQVSSSSHSITIGSQKYKAFKLGDVSERILEFHSVLNEYLPKFSEMTVRNAIGAEELFQQTIMIRWLNKMDSTVKWKTVLRYIHRMTHRTYENSPVACNIVISSERESGFNIGVAPPCAIDNPDFRKVLDQIGASPMTYIVVDPEMRYIGYRSIDTTDVKESGQGGYHPEFLNQFFSILRSGRAYKYSVHLTARRDIIVMDSQGMLCARRKGEWKLYDPPRLKGAIALALGSKTDSGSQIAAANLY